MTSFATLRAARDADYEEIAEDRALRPAPRTRSGRRFGARRGRVTRLRKRFAAVAAIDFFGRRRRSRRGAECPRLVGSGERRAGRRIIARGPRKYRARTWVTAKACSSTGLRAPVIRRFIDPDARFRFVDPETYRPMPGELRFDMFEGEFTHEGDRCTFETLVLRFGLENDAALMAIAEVVHDIDMKDAKYDRADTAGVESLLTGIARSTPNDEERVVHGGALFGALYASARGAAADATG
jgi:hypothetical protein